MCDDEQSTPSKFVCFGCEIISRMKFSCVGDFDKLSRVSN